MSKFRFLADEFKPLFGPARDAEGLDYPIRRASRMCTQHALSKVRQHARSRGLRLADEEFLSVLLIQSHSSCLVLQSLPYIICIRDMELPAIFLESRHFA
jgi:hypothetical protein